MNCCILFSQALFFLILALDIIAWHRITILLQSLFFSTKNQYVLIAPVHMVLSLTIVGIYNNTGQNDIVYEQVQR